ncbi:MAG: GGDEF domain-containing protein [Deltaproteobacteria bacterium]
MSWLINIFFIVAGFILGLIFSACVRQFDYSNINNLLASIGQIVSAPYNLLCRLFRKQMDYRKMRRAGGYSATQRLDSRDQRINDVAQTIRDILRSLVVVTQQSDKAASDSTQSLGSVRNSLDRKEIPPDFADIYSQLMKEIDTVIDSNNSLKNELAQSQEILAAQKRQIDTLHTAVRIDSLTQIANRAYFDEKLEEMISFTQRYNEPLSLVMIDLDYFKAINDTYGHIAGDRILKGVAFKLKSELRDSDFLARFGGDEFALLLIKANAQVAADVAWKLCRTMRESRFLLDDIEINVTLSIGIAEAGMGESAESLLKRADTALYHVKEFGRNSVSIADPLESNQSL